MASSGPYALCALKDCWRHLWVHNVLYTDGGSEWHSLVYKWIDEGKKEYIHRGRIEESRLGVVRDEDHRLHLTVMSGALESVKC